MSDGKSKWEMDSPYGDIKDDMGIKATKKHSKRSMKIGGATLVLILILILLISTMGDIGGMFKGIGENDDLQDLVDRPSLETIYTASPFYTPHINYVGEVGKNHVKNMDHKIEDIFKVTDEMMKNYLAMKGEMIEVINVLVPLQQRIDEIYGTTYTQDGEVMKQLEESNIEYELQELKYYSFDVNKTGDELFDSDLAYARVTAAVTAAQEITEAYHILINYSTALYCNLDEEEDEVIQQDLQEIKSLYDNSKSDEYGATLMAGVDTVNIMIDQIDSANALLALDNLETVGDNLEKVKNEVEELQSSDLVDQDFAELAKLMITEYEDMYTNLDSNLQQYVNGLNLEVSQSKGNILTDLFKANVVMAVSPNNYYTYGAGYDVQMLQKKGMEIMAAERKAYQEKYKNESYWDTAARTAKEFRQGAQEFTENVDTGVYQGARYIAGKFTPTLGDGTKDAYEDIKERNTLAKKRIAEGQGGTEVFKTAVEYFQTFQDTAGEGWGEIGKIAEEQLNLPSNSVSWVTSNMGHLAAESFTQFGQGLSRILDPNAKDSDIAKGCLEVVTSVAGGSNNIFSATKSGGAVVKKMGEMMANPSLTAKGVINAVKAIKEISLPKLGSIQYKDAIVKGTSALFKKAGSTLKSMANNVDDAFTDDVAEIFAKNWRESMIGLKNYAGKVSGNIDENAIKLMDSFIHSYIDNKARDWAAKPEFWDENITDEEKEALIADEVNKMNEGIKEGLENIQTQLEGSALNGSYNGTWTFLGVEWTQNAQDTEQYSALIKGYKKNTGVSYPCTVKVEGNILVFEMGQQDKVNGMLYNSENNNPLVKKMEVIMNKGEITGPAIETNDEVYVTSETTKDKTIIEGQYSFTYSFSEEYQEFFTVDEDKAYWVTFSFHVERNN